MTANREDQTICRIGYTLSQTGVGHVDNHVDNLRADCQSALEQAG
jgi:hypothetical protein